MDHGQSLNGLQTHTHTNTHFGLWVPAFRFIDWKCFQVHNATNLEKKIISLFLYLHINLKQHFWVRQQIFDYMGYNSLYNLYGAKFVKVWLHFIVMAEFADQWIYLLTWCSSFSFTSKISFAYFQLDACYFLHPPLFCLLTPSPSIFFTFLLVWSVASLWSTLH